MTSLRPPTTLLLGAAIACALSPTITRADVAGVFASGVDAYFSSQNDTFQISSPGAAVTAPWSPPPTGTPGVPFGGTFISPLGPPSPFTFPAGANQFGGPGAPAGFFSVFQDGFGNIATSTIQGFATAPVGGPGTGTYDDAVVAVTMSLTQVGALSYAYKELDYSIDFDFVNNPIGAMNGPVTRMFNVSGNVGAAPGSFVEFGGQMDFWEISGGIYQGKALGSLDFYYLNTTPGPFSATVTGTAPLIGGPNGGLSNPDRVRITGSFYVAGDPSTINVQSVPEPSALGLLGLGTLGLLKRNRRRA